MFGGSKAVSWRTVLPLLAGILPIKKIKSEIEKCKVTKTEIQILSYVSCAWETKNKTYLGNQESWAIKILKRR